MDALDILAIPLTAPQALFSNPHDLLRSYRTLVKEWHPDINSHPQATEVIQHIEVLYKIAKERQEQGRWEETNTLFLKGKNGKNYRVMFVAKGEDEIGQWYLGQSHMTYFIRSENQDLVENTLGRIGKWIFSDARMQEEAERFLPRLKTTIELDEGIALVFEKWPEAIRLRDLLTYLGGVIDPRHAAWIISRLYGIAYYCDYNGIVHGDFSLDTIYVIPALHTVSFPSGWWYTHKHGEKLRALPQRTMTHVATQYTREQKAVDGIDRELIRLTAREMLGSVDGTTLLKRKDIPPALAEWCWRPAPPRTTVMEEWEKWRGQTLKESFGPPRFIDMPITFADVYSNHGG